MFSMNSMMKQSMMSKQKMQMEMDSGNMQKFFRGQQIQATNYQEVLYEQLTIELVKQDKKFSFQEKANSFYYTQSSTKTFNSKATTIGSRTNLSSGSIGSIIKNEYYANAYQIIQQLVNPTNFISSQQILFQWLKLSQEKRPNLQLLGWSQIVGQGAQGSVCLDLMQLSYPDLQISNNQQQELYFPVALKRIDDADQFKREVMIIQELKYEYQPKFIFADFQNQTICMEFCISTLEDFCCIPDNAYLKNDLFMASLLIRLMNRIVGLMKTNLIHGDIKPQNTAFAIRNNKVELILLDFGASSYDTYDYCNYYTRAYCHKSIIDMVYQEKILDIDTILFNELFCACRTIQYLILEEKKSTIFSQSNYEQFKQKYQVTHPITTSIITLFFVNNSLSFTKEQFDNLIQYYSGVFHDKFNELNIDFLLQNQKSFK